MDKELQSRIWQCLPKEAREEIKKDYKSHPSAYHPFFNEGYGEALKIYFGKHNLTSDTEPSELLFVERNKVIDLYAAMDKAFPREAAYSVQTALQSLFGDKCLPDKIQDTGFGGINLTPPACKLDVKPEQPSVQDKPKFSKGDKVKIVNDSMHNGKIGKVIYIDRSIIAVELDDGTCVVWHERCFEPYTEPEAKDNMEEKELNLCELLKGCIGEWFYVTPCGEIELKEINKLELKPLHFSRDAINCLAKTDGRAYENGSCIIYPSRALYEKYPLDAYSAWMEWKEERKPKRWRAEEGKEYWYLSAFVIPEITSDDLLNGDDKLYECGNYFRTKIEARQAAEAVRETLMKFHELNQKQ